MVRQFSAARRQFLARSSGAVVSASTLSLLASHSAWAHGHPHGINPQAAVSRGYGPCSRIFWTRLKKKREPRVSGTEALKVHRFIDALLR